MLKRTITGCFLCELIQVYPGGWTAVYAFLDNPGMWNLRSQCLENWYLGQEMYVRVHDDDPNPAKEHPPPENLLLCGWQPCTNALTFMALNLIDR